MEYLKKFIYRLSFLITLVTFITCMVNGISIMTSIIRSALVFIAAFTIVIITLNLLRWSLINTTVPEEETEGGKEA